MIYFAALVAMTATAAMAQSVDEIAERAYDLLKAKNYTAAFPLILKAAEKGDCISQATLGTMYYEGKGTEKDYSQALWWWSNAKKKGCGEDVKKYVDELLTTKLVVVSNIRYILNDNNTATVTYDKFSDKTNYNGLTTVTIPEKINYAGKEYRVTSIGNEAFFACGGLKSLTIPSSVTSIGDRAFSNCTSLTSLNLVVPCSVVKVGENALSNTACFNNLPDGTLVYVGLVAYKYKGTMPSGTRIVIKDGTKGIGKWAFDGCSGLTSVTIPASVTYIGDYAFSGCSGLTSVSIPNSVTTIGNWVFHSCGGLTSVSIPNSVTSVGDEAFSDCWRIKSLAIGSSVTSLGENAFKGCNSLTSVTIPSSVTTLGDKLFYDCTDLASVTIPGSVTSIGNQVFSGCWKMKNINCNIADVGRVKIDGGAFDYIGSTSCVLHVPRGTVDAYRRTAPWNKFSNIVE